MSLLKPGMSPATATRILSKIPLFAGLANDEYRELMDVGTVASHPAGSVLFHENDSGHAMYVVLSGAVTVDTAAGGCLAVVGPGEIFGEIAVLCPMRRTATASTAEDSVLLSLSRDDLDHLLGRSPRISYLIMRNVAQTLAQRLVAANKRLGGRGPWEI